MLPKRDFFKNEFQRGKSQEIKRPDSKGCGFRKERRTFFPPVKGFAYGIINLYDDYDMETTIFDKFKFGMMILAKDPHDLDLKYPLFRMVSNGNPEEEEEWIRDTLKKEKSYFGKLAVLDKNLASKARTTRTISMVTSIVDLFSASTTLLPFLEQIAKIEIGRSAKSKNQNKASGKAKKGRKRK